ncbi:hypothetical protein L1F30_16855 [Simiduia sp. 21SJ11W-1]|uniref:hypothetical protein n=1 Tax=Simiduia sp. 21SJ11W-1 TaxID=2909669 RepID=UPI0020A18412|nr:hypothetical protein [Simiduia sp. 21SJ11W-1]UTA47811.1 hypothetical protein L1F30_16855 [Simiduia sp. 21SJ11W-1]
MRIFYILLVVFLVGCWDSTNGPVLFNDSGESLTIEIFYKDDKGMSYHFDSGERLIVSESNKTIAKVRIYDEHGGELIFDKDDFLYYLDGSSPKMIRISAGLAVEVVDRF